MLAIEQLILYIILGTLAAIVYSLRVLVLLERRISKMDENIQKITRRVLTEELKIERAAARITAKRKPVKRKKR